MKGKEIGRQDNHLKVKKETHSNPSSSNARDFIRLPKNKRRK